MQHRQAANNFPPLKTWQNSSIGLWSHSCSVSRRRNLFWSLGCCPG